MSRGPGRIERAVEQTLRDADRSFTVEELAKIAYPGLTEVRKKHRVAVLRAITNVDKRIPVWVFDTYEPPWRLIVTNRHNVRSYAHGLMRWSWWNAERTLEQIENILADPEIQSVMEPGGLWWVDVESHKAEVEWQAFARNAVAAGLIVDAGCDRIHEVPTNIMSPEWLDIGKQLTALRTYRHFLAKDMSLCALLGRFEPPGTPVFRYAMELRAAALTPVFPARGVMVASDN